MEVFKSGKICYIDKPIGATLGQAIAVYEMAEKYNVPIFSSSALRYSPQNQKLRNGEMCIRDRDETYRLLLPV